MDMILVVGGTGDLGGRVVRLLHERGEDLRCLVRARTDDAPLRKLGVEVVRGDLTEPDSLTAACRGIETVVATATVIGRRLGGARQPSIHAVDQDGMAYLITAAESAGVVRFVYVSIPGARAAGTPIERAKLATEERLRESPMRSVVVQSDGFQEIHLGPVARFDVAGGSIAIIGKGDTAHRWIGTQDVAELVAAVTLEPDPPGVIAVGGPEAISKNQVVAIAEKITGRRMKVRHMPAPVARLAARMLAKRHDALSSILGLGLFQDVQPAACDDGALRERGIHPTSVSELLTAQNGRT
jgi:uncharacterized protein YbjT (DUF2867 family)